MLNKLSRMGGVVTLHNNKYKICEYLPNTYRIFVNNMWIYFTAEGHNGDLYEHIYLIEKNNRIYRAQRYFTKYITFIRDIAYILCLNNYLWDYVTNEPLMISRENRGYNQSFNEYSKKLIGAIKEVTLC